MTRKRVILILAAVGALALTAAAQDSDLRLVNAYSTLAPRIDKARSALRGGRLEACESAARACLVALPEHHEAHFLMSQAAYQKGEYGRALDEILAAEDGSARMARAVAALEQRKLKARSDEMIRLSDEVADLSAAAASVKGRGSCMPDKYDAALGDTKEELISEEEKRNSANPVTAGVPALYLFWHGNALFKLGRPDEAEVQYRRALAVDPAFGETYNNLINLLYAAGRVEEARKVLTQAEAHKAKVHPGLKKAVLAK